MEPERSIPTPSGRAVIPRNPTLILLKVLAKIGTAEQLHIAYEAGPTGFGLQRALKAKGHVCEIVALRISSASGQYE